MTTSEIKLLTIIIDQALGHEVEEDILALGAKGFTTSEVHGKGSSGERFDAWTGTNVKIETVISAAALENILRHLKEKYFEKYPAIVYFHDVSVIRSQHFV